jgi:uncharacterized iron-regulated membrane protein
MKQKQKGVKYWIGKLHLWLGLASGIIILIVGTTGGILAFQDEIKDAVSNYRKIPVEDKHFLPPSTLKNIAAQLHPKGKITRLTLFDKERAVVALIKDGSNSFTVYLNPYSGKVLGEENMKNDFFMNVQLLHKHLLLPKQVGGQIVGIAVIVFVVMLITGLVLWWPKRKKLHKQSFTIKWNGRWKRVNYDLHKVFGFYVFAVAFIIAITGLSMSYEWVRTSLSKTANLGKVYPQEGAKMLKSDTRATNILSPDQLLDSSYVKVKTLSTTAKMITLFFPAKKEGTINIAAFEEQLHRYKKSDYYFDQYTGDCLKQKTHQSKSAGSKLEDMNYDIHTGQILGFIGKIIAFLTSLIVASLPVTGFFVWWGKNNKVKKRELIIAAVA